MKRDKPIIGVTPLWDDAKRSIWMLPGYMNLLKACGALPVILPFTSDPTDVAALVDGLDGLLLTGGHDINPAVYGQTRLPSCGPANEGRDTLECLLFSKALERDMPVFGICRGLQFINVMMDGTLFQDLPSQHPSSVRHHMSPPYDRPIHTVDVLAGTPLAGVVGEGVLKVNSYHHQGIDRLGEGLEAMAVAPDGLVEAVCMPLRRFVWGVQWHPEFMWRKYAQQRAILRSFVDVCRQGLDSHTPPDLERLDMSTP